MLTQKREQMEYNLLYAKYQHVYKHCFCSVFTSLYWYIFFLILFYSDDGFHNVL